MNEDLDIMTIGVIIGALIIGYSAVSFIISRVKSPKTESSQEKDSSTAEDHPAHYSARRWDEQRRLQEEGARRKEEERQNMERERLNAEQERKKQREESQKRFGAKQ